MRNFLTLLRSWLEQDDNPADKKELKLVVEKVAGIDLVNNALHVARVLSQTYPEEILSADSAELWADLRGCMAHPEPSVKLSAVKLLSSFLTDFAGEAAEAGEALKGSYGMELESDDVEDLVSLALGTLRAPEIEEAFANEVTQILIFLGPRLQARTRDEGPTGEALAEGDEEEAEDSRLEQRGKDLQYLFWKLSSILRQDVKSTSMGMTILFPLQAITDPHASTPFSLDEGFKTKHDALKTRAQILMDALQKKFGTAEYTKQLLAIREEVRARRQARSSKRKIEAVAHPEKYSRDKRKKTEKKKMRNKVKGQEFKAYRQAYKSW
ncbi:hypothetical protein HYQ46_011829 [Verticillium longisporum]|nr:hypothetical protein HYQ46_011829 [Verticillium longisporum]